MSPPTKILSIRAISTTRQVRRREPLTVLKDSEHSTPAQRDMVCRLAHVLGQLNANKFSLFFVHPFDILGEIREEEVPGEGNYTSDHALYDEHPSPSAIASVSAHLAKAVSQESTKSTGQGGRTEKETEALLGLGPLIPHSHQIKTCRT